MSLDVEPPAVGFGPRAAQGGRAVHPPAGPLRRRRAAARAAPRRGPAQPARARAHRVDRRVGGAEPPEGPRPDHRRRPRRPRHFDEHGNCLGGSLMDYLIPAAVEVPDWETGFTVTPSPDHPIGAKGIGECAAVGSPPAIVNAVCDALAPYGVRHVDMPCTPSRVWDAMRGKAAPPQ